MSERLQHFIKNNGIVQHGNFELASGKITDTYFDCKSLSLNADGLFAAIPPLFRALRHTTDFDAIGGVELGAVPIIGAMLMHAACYAPDFTPFGNPYKGFIVRKKPKEHGTQKFIEGPVKPGMKVAIVEDVATTGGSAHLAYIRAKEFGLEPVVIGCIVNRNEGADELFKSLNIPFVYLLQKSDLIDK